MEIIEKSLKIFLQYSYEVSDGQLGKYIMLVRVVPLVLLNVL